MTNPNDPASPTYWYDYLTPGVQVVRETFYGLTKREQIAAMAMEGILSNPAKDYFPIDLGREATACADALLAALNEKGAE